MVYPLQNWLKPKPCKIVLLCSNCLYWSILISICADHDSRWSSYTVHIFRSIHQLWMAKEIFQTLFAFWMDYFIAINHTVRIYYHTTGCLIRQSEDSPTEKCKENRVKMNQLIVILLLLSVLTTVSGMGKERHLKICMSACPWVSTTKT